MNTEVLSAHFAIREMPKISYIICASQRSGSNLLCEVLRSSGISGSPDEFFLYWYMAERQPEMLRNDFVKPWLVPPVEFMKKLIREGSTPNGVFGVKIMWDYFDIVINKLKTIADDPACPPAKIIESFFPNSHYIFMVRKDKVRQAVSFAKAIQTRKWFDLEQWVWDEKPDFFMKKIDQIKFNAENICKDKPAYNFDQIFTFYNMFIDQDKAWKDFFRKHEITPHIVVYEDFIDSLWQTALDIIDYLDIPKVGKIDFRRLTMQRQSDAVNEEWAQRFTLQLAGLTT